MTSSKKQQLRRTIAGIACVAVLATNTAAPAISKEWFTPISVSALSISQSGATTYDISTMSITNEKITVNITQNGTYVLTGSNLRNDAYVDVQVTVAEGVTANIIMDNLQIKNNEGSSFCGMNGFEYINYTDPFIINGTANVYIKSNSSIYGYYYGILLNGTLNIKESENGAKLAVSTGDAAYQPSITSSNTTAIFKNEGGNVELTRGIIGISTFEMSNGNLDVSSNGINASSITISGGTIYSCGSIAILKNKLSLYKRGIIE